MDCSILHKAASFALNIIYVLASKCIACATHCMQCLARVVSMLACESSFHRFKYWRRHLSDT